MVSVEVSVPRVGLTSRRWIRVVWPPTPREVGGAVLSLSGLLEDEGGGVGRAIVEVEAYRAALPGIAFGGGPVVLPDTVT